MFVDNDILFDSFNVKYLIIVYLKDLEFVKYYKISYILLDILKIFLLSGLYFFFF